MMGHVERKHNYWIQNGVQDLTPAQRRRYVKKALREAKVRGSVKVSA